MISENLTYLGSVLGCGDGLSQEVIHQVGMAHGVMDWLRLWVFGFVGTCTDGPRFESSNLW